MRAGAEFVLFPGLSDTYPFSASPDLLLLVLVVYGVREKSLGRKVSTEYEGGRLEKERRRRE